MSNKIPLMVDQELIYMAIIGYKVDNRTAEYEIEELLKRGSGSFVAELKQRIENNNSKVSDLEAIMLEHWNVENIRGMI